MTAPAFYRPLGDDEFESTSATASPWDLSLQHGGPPAALLARAVERTRTDDDLQVARYTVDMLGGIPQGRIRTEAHVVRPGRRVELVEASLWANDQLAVRASAWRIRCTEGSTAHLTGAAAGSSAAGPGTPAGSAVPAVPDEVPTAFFSGVPDDWGYGRAIDWRFVEGGYDVDGPALVWTRLRVPLVEGEETTGLQRMLVVADSTNGLSGALPMSEWFFIPPTLTVTTQRHQSGEWMLLDARSTVGPDGIGLAEGRLSDAEGPLGVAAQPLLVAPR